MNNLCFYGYVCEDHDAIDVGPVDERSIRGLQFAARANCNACRCTLDARAAIASGTRAAADALASMANIARRPCAVVRISIDEIVGYRHAIRSDDDVFMQRGSVRRAADAVGTPAYRFRKTLVGPRDARL
ncbi:hypothetical protein [Burkholderia sp. BCC1993]|uniref:hypothetical protein n=1 Tax=Burkholderia sp. BCC1993 TaxID=2817444 RepID=UPI002AAF6E81|nr:hypothetical protein [Burkholderia sp. BCC1993]